MPDPEVRRVFIKAANLQPYHMNADEVDRLLRWFRELPSAHMTLLLQAGIEFPNGYIDLFLKEDNGDAQATE